MNSKKPFDHIEEKIKQAADHYQPPFDERAWEAMEAKLDSDNKKRRPLLWWFVLPLLLAGGGYGIYTLSNKYGVKETPVAESKTVPEKKQNENVVSENELTTAAVNSTVTNKTLPANNNTTKNAAIESNASGDIIPSASNDFKNNHHPGTSKINNKPVNNNNTAAETALTKEGKISYRKKARMQATTSGGETGISGDTKVTISGNETAVNEINNEVVKPAETEIKQKETVASAEKPALVKQGDKKDEKEELNKKVVNNKEEQKPVAAKQEKQKEKKQGGFYVQATGGTDAGSMHLFSYDNSKITGKFGVGLGYKFGKRLSAQTGFYATNKKYGAVGTDYKIKAGSPMAMYPIEQIKAACLVYEIPLAIKYDIISKPSFILFGTAGVSSYIMQKEKYNCSYTYYNVLYENEWDYKGNSHLFSTAVFSFGIEKKLSGNLFLLAEPSFSIPLSGVGDGKMNIYSSSLQAGVKYYFGKK